jgi:hypothetical protein
MFRQSQVNKIKIALKETEEARRRGDKKAETRAQAVWLRAYLNASDDEVKAAHSW